MQGSLEKALRDERQARADVMADTSRADKIKAEADQMVREMRRELQISKDEARRAWEELGRREQEERDRTTSLRNGEPTLVGGVQVVPMTMGVSRQTSTNRPSTRDGPGAAGIQYGTPGASLVAAQTRRDTSGDSPTQRYSYDTDPYSAVETDPFTEGTTEQRILHHEPDVTAFDTTPLRTRQQPQSSQPPPSTPTRQPQTYQHTSDGSPSTRFYQQSTAPTLHPQAPPTTGVSSEPDSRSYVPSTISSDLGEEEYEIDDHGNYRRDESGRRIVYRHTGSPEHDDDNESDEYDVQDQQERERAYQARYGGNIPTSGVEYGSGDPARYEGQRPGQPADSSSEEPDYSGQGWGAGSGWEAVQRHRHPTRLSDVLEEDERSRVTEN
jgi:hypothetical protein